MTTQLSEFLKFLIELNIENNDRLPTLEVISKKIGVSISSLREQLEVARALGFVDIRPRSGIKKIPYTFSPTVQLSLTYALQIDPKLFQAYSDLRNHIETAYFYQAVCLLTPEDHYSLNKLVSVAKEKLSRNPVHIPTTEHKEFHLTIYKHLNNLFVTGLLEAYWTLYEAVGLNVYTDIDYFKQVWVYHEKIVGYLITGDFASAYQSLVDHMGLLTTRPITLPWSKFE